MGPLGTRAIFMLGVLGVLGVGVVEIVGCPAEEHGDLAGLGHLAEALLLDDGLRHGVLGVVDDVLVELRALRPLRGYRSGWS